jgi:DNA-binding GntR family transcriptional regulator
MSSANTALAPRALYEEVAERLREQILARELEPGSWIDEMKLASAWGISRTPMREAIKVLAAEGLVTMKVRRGAYVTEASAEDVAQIYHLLALLESDAAGQVAQHRSDADLAELQALHEQLESTTRDRNRFFEINERFHFRLLDLAHNRWRMQLVQELRQMMKLSRHHSLFKKGRVQESLQEHRQLMDALAQGDGAAATAAMRQHFANSLKATSAVPTP